MNKAIYLSHVMVATHFILAIILTANLVHTAVTNTNCRFPFRWEGTWFQSGIRQPIVITGDRLSTKGRCIEADGDKFLVVKDDDTCFRCVVIHEKHINVLQYKETYCHTRNALNHLCSYITGDALLYSMFRVDSEPVQCPFRGPFTFTYNRGYGECDNPVSTIDSCTEDSRILLRYQACPDVPGSESTVEELQCLAEWKEGSSRYLVGQLHSPFTLSQEDRYRCFVYEKAKEEEEEDIDFRVAQSGDATCNGLFSAMEGSRTMSLKLAPKPSLCLFAHWLTAPRTWHTLDYRKAYHFDNSNTTLRISNSSDDSLEMRVLCTQAKETAPDKIMLVTHVTTGCLSGYVCTIFYKRDGHVIEVQTGTYSRRPEDACTQMYFNLSALPYITLVTTSPEPRQCPHLGQFSVTGVNKDGRRVRDATCADGFGTLVVGCSTTDVMEFRSSCTAAEVIAAYSCHGRWEDDGTSYLITTPLSRSSKGARRFCFIYRQLHHINPTTPPERTFSFSSSADSCRRSITPGVGGALAFNVTSSGQCLQINSVGRLTSSLLLLILSNLILFIYHPLIRTRHCWHQR